MAPIARNPARRRAILLGLAAGALSSRRVSAAPLTAAPAARPLRLLALGDSLTAGYGLARADGFVARLQDALDAAHADTRVLDGGVSGDTSADALARLDWVLADRPDAAIVELGGNDALRGLDPATMERQIREIVGRLQAAHIPVLVCGMLAPPNMGPAYAAQFRAAFARIATIPGILWEPFFLEGVAGHPALQQADHIHPSPAGVNVMVREILPLVETLLARARAARI